MLASSERDGVIWRRLISVVAFLMSAGTGGASALQGREILATGDNIPGLGHVGVANVQALGIDDAGRVLIGGGLVTGDSGLFWINNGATTPLWVRSQSKPAVWLYPDGYSVSVSDNGNVAALGNEEAPTNCSYCFSSIYRVREEGVERVVSIGDSDADGNRLCSFSQPGLQINDSGEMAFLADVAPPGFSCSCRSDDSDYDDGDYWCPPAALYVTSVGQLRRVAGTNELSPPGQRVSDIQVIGLTRNGAAIFLADGTHVMWADGSRVRQLVAKGDLGPSGSALGPLNSVAANSLGEVAFLSSENGTPSVYRLTEGRIAPVIPGNVAPTGAPLCDFGFHLFLNDRGDVAVDAAWLTTAPDGYQYCPYGVLWYPASGDPSVVLTGGIAVASDNAGDLVVAHYSYEGRPGEILRWHDGQAERIFGAGDVATTGALFAEGGVEQPTCLAPNGLAAVTAFSLEDNRYGLSCIDRAGPHLIARSGDTAPGDGTLDGFYQCAFADDGAIFFASPVSVQTDPHTYTYYSACTVYRATGQAVERFIGPGDIATDGTRLNGPSLIGSPPTCFASNLRGTVVVQGNTDSGIGLFRRRVGEPLEHLTIAAAGVTVNRYSSVKALGVLDYDTVAVVLYSSEDYRTSPILLINSNGTRSLAPSAGSLVASGDRITFAGPNWPEDPIFAYQASDATLQPLDLVLPPGIVSLGVPSFVAATPNGNSIFSAYFQDSDLSGGGGYFLLDGDSVQFLSKTSEVGYTTPTGLNDRGNLLLQGWSPRTSGRQVLQLTGPPAAGTCAVANGTPRPAPTSTPGPIFTPTPTQAIAVPTCAGDCPTLQAGSETGLPGQQVTVAITLRTHGAAIVAIQNDLSVDAPALSVVGCQVNTGIHKPDSAFALFPKGCTPGIDCRSLRALVFSLDIGSLIADGAVMYTCTFASATNAAPGRYSLHVTNEVGADAGGHEIALAGTDGEILVQSMRAASGSVAAVSGVRTGGGCAITRTSASRSVPFAVVLPWVWALASRRRHAPRWRSSVSAPVP
jgi:hypothetical protein